MRLPSTILEHLSSYQVRLSLNSEGSVYWYVRVYCYCFCRCGWFFLSPRLMTLSKLSHAVIFSRFLSSASTNTLFDLLKHAPHPIMPIIVRYSNQDSYELITVLYGPPAPWQRALPTIPTSPMEHTLRTRLYHLARIVRTGRIVEMVRTVETTRTVRTARTARMGGKSRAVKAIRVTRTIRTVTALMTIRTMRTTSTSVLYIQLTATALIVVVPQIADTTLDGNHLAHLGNGGA